MWPILILDLIINLKITWCPLMNTKIWWIWESWWIFRLIWNWPIRCPVRPIHEMIRRPICAFITRHITWLSNHVTLEFRLIWGGEMGLTYRLYLGVVRRKSNFWFSSGNHPKYDLRSRRESSRKTVCSRIEYLSPFSSSLFPHQRVLWLFINFDPKSIGEMIDRLSIAV